MELSQYDGQTNSMVPVIPSRSTPFESRSKQVSFRVRIYFFTSLQTNATAKMFIPFLLQHRLFHYLAQGDLFVTPSFRNPMPLGYTQIKKPPRSVRNPKSITAFTTISSSPYSNQFNSNTIYFFKIHFNIILQSILVSRKWSRIFNFSD
jgi:hypothetical protein